jgi:hypothetical protein
VIVVDEGERRLVLGTAANGVACQVCGSEQRVVAVRYQVFGFFGAFGASWSRHYFIECRQCRTTLSAIERSEFETTHGNAIPFGQRLGLLALGVLIALTLVVLSIGGRSTAIRGGLAVVWAVVVIALWRIAWTSTFTRRRRRRPEKSTAA